MKLLFTLLALSFSLAATAQRAKPIVSPIQSYTAKALLQRIAHPDTTYIVTFWTTWCPRCMRELPEFETLHQRYKGTAVKVLMVSLDVQADLKTKLPLYVKSNVNAEVIWLNEKDMETYMPQIDKTWTGMLPATLVLEGPARKRTFMERVVTAGEITAMLPAAEQNK